MKRTPPFLAAPSNPGGAAGFTGVDLRDPAAMLRSALSDRQVSLHGRRGLFGTTPIQDAVTADINASIESLTPDKRQEIALLEHEARKERAAGVMNGEASVALHGIRLKTYNNYLVASSMIAAGFFEVIDLADDEVPVYLGETKQEVSFNYVGQNGGVFTRTFNNDDLSGDPVKIQGVARTSGWVRYPIMDIGQGRMLDSVPKTLDIARDLSWIKDNDLWALAKSQLASFSGKLTGKKANRAWNFHSSVKTANFPATNVIDATAGSILKIQKILNAVIKYETSWGRGTFPDGDLMATGEIFISANELADLFSELSIASQTSNVGNEIMKAGEFSVTYLGRNWKFIPLATTQMTAKKVYPRWNKKVGVVFHKKASPLNGEEIVREGDYNGWEKRRATAWWAAYCPAPWAMNICEIQYIP